MSRDKRLQDRSVYPHWCTDTVRFSDQDAAGHVNNAVHWAAVEDELAGLDWLPGGAELEYHRPIRPGAEPELVTSREPGELRAWLRQGPQRLASAWLTAAARP